MPGLHFELGHDRFFPHHFKFIVQDFVATTFILYTWEVLFRIWTQTPSVVTDFLFCIFLSPQPCEDN
jgi:hypothetical protein